MSAIHQLDNMNIRQQLILFFLFLFPTSLYAGINANIADSKNPIFQHNMSVLEAKLDLSTPTVIPSPPKKSFVPFGVGEKFTYSVGWSNVIAAGKVTVEVENTRDYQGHEVYRVVVIGKSVAPVSIFYRIREELESLIDVSGLFTRRYWTNQDENGRKYERKYEFDPENNSVLHEDKTYYSPYGVHDEVSAVFYIRTMDLQVGKSVYVDIFAKEKTWRVRCNVLKIETIKVPAGEFETIIVQPELQFDGVVKKGKVTVWFTNDTRRIPVQVQTKIMIGSILVRLKDYQMSNEVIFD